MINQEEEEDTPVESTQNMIEEEEEDSSNIKDKYFATYFLFYAIGVLTLVPANFFTTATDYWMYKFRDPTNESFDTENRTGLQADFISNYSIVTTVSNFFFVVVTIIFVRKVGIVSRVIFSLCGAIVMFGITILFVIINTDSFQYTFYIITLLIGFFLTGFCAVFTVTVFEMVAKFPPEYIAGILTGQSVCGIIAALVQIFSLSIGASSKTNGLVYFLIGMFFVFISLVSYLMVLMKSEFFRFHLNKVIETGKMDFSRKVLKSVLSKVKFYLLSMILVLGCSIIMHPGVTSLVISKYKGNGNKWNDVFFVPVVTFLFFHLFEYIGREIAGKLLKPKNSLIILIISLCRVAIVPLILLCNAQPRHHLPVIFNDYGYIAFIILFSISNGYLVNLCVIRIPIAITEDNERKLSMLVILVAMLFSLGICSFLSAAMVKAL